MLPSDEHRERSGRRGCGRIDSAGPVTHRILVCRPNGRLGNTLLLTPLLQEIEAIFPGAEVDILTAYPGAAEIFREFGSVYHLHQLPRLGVRHPLQMLAVFLRARAIAYDLIIDASTRSRSGRFWTRILRARHKIGFGNTSTGAGLTLAVAAQDAPQHMGQQPVYLLRRALGGEACVERGRKVPPLDLLLTEHERRFGASKVSHLCPGVLPSGPLLSVFANTRSKKRLPAHWWDWMLNELTEHLPQVQILEILPTTGGAWLRGCASYFSTSVRRVAAVIAATDCFVSSDCGVMHLGAATGTPTLGLFMNTSPAVYAPYGVGSGAILVQEHAPARAAEEIAQHLERLASNRTVRRYSQ